MFSWDRSAALAAAAMLLAGCASLPREQGYREAAELVQARRGVMPPSPDAADARPPLPGAPLDANEAVRLAFFYNPRIRAQYARIGLGRAELEEARRIANPSFGFVRLSPRGGEGAKFSRSVSVGLADLLLLPARNRFAQGELERLQREVAADLLELATQVESAWYEAVGAEQVARMREVVRQASDASAELAQRFFDAGNITRLALEQERAAAAEAGIAAVRARAEALRARVRLAGLIGLSSQDAWTLQTQLPAPADAPLSDGDLIPLALENRLDLAAARQAVALREDALGVSRRWRWLGGVELGYERESEPDGEVLRGPSLSLELPIFDQGQGAVARARAELLEARAELDARVLEVENAARLSLEELAAARDIAERYRRELVPRREAIVARTQEDVNYMLVGVFELLRAKQEEYDAYQEYLEAVRDYWVARAGLRGAVGGRLPDDDAPLQPTIGVDAILPGAAASGHHHGMDHGAKGQGSGASEEDPHAGHATPVDDPDDPHAAHRHGAAQEPPAAGHEGHEGHGQHNHDADEADEDPSDDAHDHGDTP